MKTYLPTLTIDGNVEHIPTLLLKIYEYFIVSDYSQSVCFYGKINSLRYLIYKYQSDIEELEGEVKKALYNTVNNYLLTIDGNYESLEVDVTIEDDDDGYYTIKVDITAVVDDTSYNLTKELSMNTTSFLLKESSLNYLETGEI